ncbi:hypothetical protein B0H11DRAFT_660524 [Mycena galericulata]|nr:hypothetical protein B0H11DRAFT_660524 [Mycena galericulata]
MSATYISQAPSRGPPDHRFAVDAIYAFKACICHTSSSGDLNARGFVRVSTQGSPASHPILVPTILRFHGLSPSSIMFEQCSNFTIFGGTFITYPESTAVQPRCSIATKPRSPSFRSIPLGDLNLLSEIGIQEIVEYRDVRRHKTGVLIRRQREVVGMRRIYQAQIFGNPGIVTAVIDQGTSFEKWKTEAEKHETFRHPSLVQLYAVTMTQAMNALIYTDGLVSLRDVREFHACSPLASTYVEYGIKRDLYVCTISLLWLLHILLIYLRLRLNTGKAPRGRGSCPPGRLITRHGSASQRDVFALMLMTPSRTSSTWTSRVWSATRYTAHHP